MAQSDFISVHLNASSFQLTIWQFATFDPRWPGAKSLYNPWDISLNDSQH